VECNLIRIEFERNSFQHDESHPVDKQFLSYLNPVVHFILILLTSLSLRANAILILISYQKQCRNSSIQTSAGNLLSRIVAL